MHLKSKSTVVLLLMIVAMTTMLTPVFAEDSNYANEIYSDSFDVSVPTILPADADTHGNVCVSDSVRIINNSQDPVCVSGLEVKSQKNWEIGDYDSELISNNVVAMNINNCKTTKSGSVIYMTENFPYTENNNCVAINYDVKLPAKTSTSANIIFSIAKCPQSIDNSLLPSFTTSYYIFTDDTSNTGGYMVSLNPDFKAALEANNGVGTQYKEWKPGTPLPNPGSMYNSKPVTSMYGMFCDCRATNLNLSNFDTSRIVNMSNMFVACKAIHLNLGNLDTSKVVDMSGMFLDCKAIDLDLSNFNTSNVTNMKSMFMGCRATNLNLSSFNTSRVTNMTSMFQNCFVENLNLSSFDTSNVTYMGWMFYTCHAKNIDLSSFDMSNVTYMGYMFEICETSTVYIHTQECVSMFNSSARRPAGLKLVVKP